MKNHELIDPIASPDRTAGKQRSASDPLIHAALSGLLGLGVTACSEERVVEPDPCPDAGTRASSEDAGPAEAFDGGPADAGTSDAGPPDSTPDAPVVLSEVEGDRTYASLRADCDARGGYVQIHAACAGVNACAGFSYGDWDPGVLTEHTCAGVNGCNGLSCVVLPEDEGRTGAEILEMELPETGPRSCTNCHAVWTDDGPDASVFKVYTLPGSGRNADNWLDGITPEEQGRIIAFGSTGRLPDGQAFAHMSAYHKLFSRAEIERTVEHIRSSTTLRVIEYRTMD